MLTQCYEGIPAEEADRIGDTVELTKGEIGQGLNTLEEIRKVKEKYDRP